MRQPNKRMQLTKLRAAPERQAEVPPCAPAGESDGGTASQLIRSVRPNLEGAMIVCRVCDPTPVAGWKSVFEMEVTPARLPPPIAFEYPNWSESVIERSFLKQPEILAKGLRVASPHDGLLALRQVARIDLYLRAGQQLHLLELKKATEYGKWQVAAAEIARQWCNSAAWLRRDVGSVYLWVMSPVRWSRSRRTAKIPGTWRTSLSGIAQRQLTGMAQAELGMLFYGLVRAGGERYVLMWQADEPPPVFDVQ